MPDVASYDPISAGNYLSLFSNLEIAGMFSFSGKPNSILSSIELPVHAVVGSQDEYIELDAGKHFELLHEALPMASSYTSKVVIGANHEWIGFEIVLSAILSAWARTYGDGTVAKVKERAG
jgi:hypothetical protein